MNTAAEILRLCHVPKGMVSNITIELTSRCNLRCLYCSVPQPVSYGAQDLGIPRLNGLLNLLSGHAVASFSVSGRGELTAMSGWQNLCERLLGLGIPLHSVINLAAPLSWEQAGTLSRFQALSVSIDSADRDVMKEIRKGADLKTIISNVALIRAAAFAKDHQPPFIGVIAVATACSIQDIRPLAGLVAAIGAKSLLVQDLVMDYAQAGDNSPASAVCTLSNETLKASAANLFEAEALLEKHGISFSVWPSLVELLGNAACGQDTDIETVSVSSPLLGDYRRHAPRLQPGRTRLCTDPWDMVILLADGKVQPCCGGYESIADSSQAQSLDEIVNARDVVELRRRLLTGELDDWCRVCSRAREVDARELQEIVAQRFQ